MNRREFLNRNLTGAVVAGAATVAAGSVMSASARVAGADVADEAMLILLNDFARNTGDHINLRTVIRQLGREFEQAVGLPVITTADLDLEKHCIERTLSPRFVLDVDDASVVEGNLPVARFTSVTNTAPARTRFNFARTLLDTARRIIEDVSDDVHSRDAFSILEASIYISREFFHVQLFGWCTYVKNK